MHLSASKQKNMTTLEVQAQNMVNENDSDGDYHVNDEERYNEILESRKNRRKVSSFGLFDPNVGCL